VHGSPQLQTLSMPTLKAVSQISKALSDQAADADRTGSKISKHNAASSSLTAASQYTAAEF